MYWSEAGDLPQVRVAEPAPADVPAVDLSDFGTVVDPEKAALAVYEPDPESLIVAPDDAGETVDQARTAESSEPDLDEQATTASLGREALSTEVDAEAEEVTNPQEAETPRHEEEPQLVADVVAPADAQLYEAEFGRHVTLESLKDMVAAVGSAGDESTLRKHAGCIVIAHPRWGSMSPLLASRLDKFRNEPPEVRDHHEKLVMQTHGIATSLSERLTFGQLFKLSLSSGAEKFRQVPELKGLGPADSEAVRMAINSAMWFRSPLLAWFTERL